MRRLGTAILALVLALLLTTGSPASPRRSQRSARSGPAATPALAVRADNGLALALLRRLGGSQNTVFSPYSVQTALAMVDQGAGGSTAEALNRALGAPGSASSLAASERALSAALKRAVTGHGPRLNNADALWIRTGLRVEDAFTSTLGSDFGASPFRVNFAASPDTARQAINRWIAARTDQLIPQLFPAGTITSSTALVLANAIYLQASWSDPFDPNLTAPGSFSTALGRSVQTPFMETPQDLPDSLPYASGSGWVAVGLPYAHSSLQLLAVMPSLGTLARFESRELSLTRLNAIATALSARPVRLSMPKLTLSINTNLDGPLSALGLGVAFSNEANFDRITPRGGLQITDVQHDAVLKLDEKGTVAAAATGVVVGPTAVEPVQDSVLLDLNHPFLLFLRDTRTGAILFAGRVADPAS